MEDIYKSIEDLHVKIDKLLQVRTTSSTDKSELYKALSAAQAEMEDVTYTGENELYKDKYATLGDLVRMSRPALTKHGLAVTQDIYQDEGGQDILRTTLSHVSGKTLSSTMRILPNKNTLHQIGSYLSYIRRISYASLIGIMVHDMDDDDGHAAMNDIQERMKKGTDPSIYSSDTNSKEYKRISKQELLDLEKSMGNHYDLGESILDQYGIEKLADIPASKYQYILGQMRKNVAYRSGTLLSN